MKIKICGLKREEDIAYVNECMPDFVGFVFAKSRRKVTKEEAANLRALLKPEITPVGVFVNEDIQRIAELVRNGIIDVVQLHGDETKEYIRELKWVLSDVTIIKAVRVASKEDVAGCENLPVDYLLFDTFSLKGYGGLGNTFDWELVKDVKKPFFLAGGISSENVSEAFEKVNPFAVDLSSAVETDGFKDSEKIKAFVEQVRSLS